MVTKVSKVLITDQGDMSVGINPATITIEANFELASADKEAREAERELLRKTFKELYDLIGKVYVVFEDECFDCGKILEKTGKGKYKSCNCEVA